jgi:Ca-activated chloride channel family protein
MRWFLAALLLGSLARPSHAAPQPACDVEIESLDARFRTFLVDAELLLSDDERDTFLCLRKDYQRDAFIAEFWEARDPYPDTARNELAQQWEERLLQVRQLFPDLDDPRARYWLLEGPPSMRAPICAERSASKVEAWFYGFESRGDVYEAVATRRLRRGQHAVLFFAPYGTGRWQVWMPGDRIAVYAPTDAGSFGPPGHGAEIPSPGLPGHRAEGPSLGAGCDRDLFEAARVVLGLEIESTSAIAYMIRTTEALEKRPPPSSEWLTTFRSYSTDVPAEAPRLGVDVDVRFPAQRGSRVLVEVQGVVDRDTATLAEALGYRAYAFELIGEILRPGPVDEDPVLFDSFRYRFELPHDPAQDEPALVLVAQRYLRPGLFTLILRLDDLHGDAAWRTEIPIEVPRLEMLDVSTPTDLQPAFEEAEGVLATVEPTLEIVPPAADLVSGYLRFETRTTGPIERVAFYLDDVELLTKTRAPFSVDLDLGRLPQSRLLRTVGFDREGKEVASDAYLVNGSPHRFAVRLVDPIPGSRHREMVRARVDVVVPTGRNLDRLELYRDEDLVATLYQEPFVQPVPLPGGPQLTILRAVAYLADGDSLEDTVLINGAAPVDEVHVELVELYTTVAGRDGRTIPGLAASDFRVREDGIEQTVERFERVDDTPIRGTILLDTSASMADRLERATEAAARFFRRVVRARDELSVISFNDRPHVTVPFTGHLPELGRGLIGLRAERGTALYDSLVYALHHLNGLGGQRVVLLLTDGEDEHSRFSFEDTVEYARRSRAAIYAIGIDLARHGEKSPRTVLETLASETGGRAFFLDDLDSLDRAYEEIALELRSKYFLAYQSSSQAAEGVFRTIEVEVARKGAEARTLRGYYP